MAKRRPAKRGVSSYTIRGTNKVVRAGDCVLMRPQEKYSLPYVARVQKIEADNRDNVRVHVRWYYRPEESVGGRRKFHGTKELLLSDHYDIQSACTIEGKCTIHTFEDYTKLERVWNEDYYCRFEYQPASGALLPILVPVYCKCEQPYNPDDLMMQCEECEDWFHPRCVGMTIEEAKQLDRFVCCEHESDENMKKPLNTPLANGNASLLVKLLSLYLISSGLILENTRSAGSLGWHSCQLIKQSLFSFEYDWLVANKLPSLLLLLLCVTMCEKIGVIIIFFADKSFCVVLQAEPKRQKK